MKRKIAKVPTKQRSTISINIACLWVLVRCTGNQTTFGSIFLWSLCNCIGLCEAYYAGVIVSEIASNVYLALVLI
jgi:hypothetical protein